MEFEGNEQLNSDVGSSEAPSEPQQEAAKDTQPNLQEAGQESSVKPQPDSQVPFHEHPRFRELVEQKNQFAQQFTQAQSMIEQLQAKVQQFEKSQAPRTPQEDALMARLKGIDPEFGGRFETVAKSAQTVEQLMEEVRNLRSESIRTQYETQVSRLHADNKVPEGLQKLYDAQIRARAAQDPRLGIKDLPRVYKEIHDSYQKIFEERDRQARESYVTDKKKDASIPTPQAQKGKSPTQSAKPQEWAKDEAERRAQLIKRVLTEAKASKDV